jgi:cell fate regulator YaaT (PSP1 superfamily)
MPNVMSLTRTELVGVRFQKLGKLYHFRCTDLPEVQKGDHVVVEMMHGLQLGQVMGFVAPERGVREYRPVIRMATARDMLLKQNSERQSLEVLINCREQASLLGGYSDCKFVEAQLNFEVTHIAILFSVSRRSDANGDYEDEPAAIVNMNRLRAAMESLYPNTFIELRKIGERDVAKALGGMGACGITRCCSTFLTEFSPISIKMAKAQGISLDPSEITGMCGRLRCCLIFEYEQYVQARRELPKRNKMVQTPHGEGKVLDVHPLQDSVTVLVGETVHLVHRDDLQPLDELQALQKKAEQPCSKHEGGGCNCGAHGAAKPSDTSATEQDSQGDDSNDHD